MTDDELIEALDEAEEQASKGVGNALGQQKAIRLIVKSLRGRWFGLPDDPEPEITWPPASTASVEHVRAIAGAVRGVDGGPTDADLLTGLFAAVDRAVLEAVPDPEPPEGGWICRLCKKPTTKENARETCCVPVCRGTWRTGCAHCQNV